MGDGTAGPTLMGVDAGFGRPVEAALLGRAGQGDRQAQGQLYRHYADAMYRLALRTLGCAAEAEEVVHDEPEYDTYSDDEPDFPEPAEEAAIHTETADVPADTVESDTVDSGSDDAAAEEEADSESGPRVVATDEES